MRLHHETRVLWSGITAKELARSDGYVMAVQLAPDGSWDGHLMPYVASEREWDALPRPHVHIAATPALAAAMPPTSSEP